MRIRPAVVAVAAAVALGGCGIPLSQNAQSVSSRGLSPELSGRPAPSTTTPKPPPVATQHASHLVVYLVDPSTERLVQVQRDWPPPVTPNVALNVLALGPDSADPQGLETYLPQAPHTPVSISKNGVATVTLDETTYSELFGASLYLPLAQIVYTLMANFSHIKGVNFFLAGELYNYVPNGSNDLQPVTPKAYAALAPVPPKKR